MQTKAQNWINWIRRAERIIGREIRDFAMIDAAYSAFECGVSPLDYVASVAR